MYEESTLEERRQQENVEQVQVSFFTSLDEFRVTEKPFHVPINISRRGLSRVINHLLENGSAISFDFLIQNKFLRTTIGKFIKEKGLSTEQVLEIEYVKLLEPPVWQSSFTFSDWVSSIDDHLLDLQKLSKGLGIGGNVIPYGSYDQKVHLLFHDTNGNDVSHFVVGEHKKPIMSVSTSSRPSRANCDEFLLASSSMDGSICVWNINLQSRSSFLKYALNYHEKPVECVSFSPSGNMLSSASWDNKVGIWTFSNFEDDQIDSSPDNCPRVIEPRSIFEEHIQCVSSVTWMSDEEIATGSWDHSIRIWDVESGVTTNKLQGNKVCLAIDYSPKNGLILTGHADSLLRVWDPRSSNTTAKNNSICSTFNSHTGWISSAKWKPDSEYIMISGSHDSCLKTWDIRSQIPLHTHSPMHGQKVFTLGWLSEKGFCSGGTDKSLFYYHFDDSLTQDFISKKSRN